jgi:transcriptional regulator with XRE-family HTH domain
MVISAAQIRAARALVGWTQAKLAAESGLSEISIQNIEKGTTDPRASTLAAIERALRTACVEFTNGDHPGVRLLRRQSMDRLTVEDLHRVARRTDLNNMPGITDHLEARETNEGLSIFIGVEDDPIGRIWLIDQKTLQFDPPFPDELPTARLTELDLWKYARECHRIHKGGDEPLPISFMK